MRWMHPLYENPSGVPLKQNVDPTGLAACGVVEQGDDDTKPVVRFYASSLDACQATGGFVFT